MNSFAPLLDQLSASPEALAAVAVLLLLIGMTLRTLLRRQPGSNSMPRRPDLLPEAVIRQPARPASPPEPAVADETAPEDSEDQTLSYEVDDLDALAEIEVFLEFGYLEQAALALRTYVDGPSSNAPAHVRRLAELYLQLDWIDDYSDMLERLHERSLLDRQQLTEAVFAGLQQDPQNLALRVLAESRLGLGIEEVNRQLGDQLPATNNEDLLLRTVMQTPGQPAVSADEAVQLASQMQRVPLLVGQAELAPLSQREIDLLTSLLPAERQARILLACHQPAAALPALQQLASAPDAALTRLIDTLRACYMTRNLPLFCRYLWQFHVSVGNFGHQLKQQLLQLGCQLGQHPLLLALESQPDRLALEELGRRFAYIQPVSTPPQWRQLVTADHSPATASPLDNALSEAEQFIEFGQIDMAIQTLETAILASPAEAQLYPPLLNLYEHLGDLARFTWLAKQIRDRLATPPEEITGMLGRFVQTMQQRLNQHRLAA
ncbi:hypothetical protein DBR44_08275 [Aquitalea sp. FJL05]|uniref:hypothetical protein n=1 Tax=Aquitalea sp. FJL05 TaxID=2153366 RepID=UPI000F5904F9|nr:hypothetical protein [Aquitalea sp. FJL05]RQO72925.1 hypothetical protein DBR44_08275 [Aquitalea sp. FJL05]